MHLHETMNNIQKNARDAILASLDVSGKALIRMATGTGKTETGIKVIQEKLLMHPELKVLILTHKNELIRQWEARIKRYNIKAAVGTFDAENKNINSQITIASIPTLHKKHNLKKFKKKHFDLILVDEVHHSPAETWSRTIAHFDALKVGLTATPYRPDGRSLDEAFGDIVYDLSFSNAQDQGILARDHSCIILTNTVLHGATTKDGEYKPGALDRLFTSSDRNKIIIDSYKKYGRKIMEENGIKFKAICFCINSAHAIRMSKLFNKNGIKSTFISSDLSRQSKIERAEIYKKFDTSHELEILCAVDILNEGVDIPDVGCVIMSRPTRSNVVYQQQIGRGARRIVGKKDVFVVLDFVDNTRREWQCYTMSNLTNKKATKNNIITHYLDNPDPIIVDQKINDIMWGIKNFESKVARRTPDFYTEEIIRAHLLETRYPSLKNFKEKGGQYYKYAFRLNSWIQIRKEFFPDANSLEWNLEEFIEVVRKSGVKNWEQFKKISPKMLQSFYRHVPKKQQRQIAAQLKLKLKPTRSPFRDFHYMINFLKKKKYGSLKQWQKDHYASYQQKRLLSPKKQAFINSKFFPNKALNRYWNEKTIESRIKASGASSWRELQKIDPKCNSAFSSFIKKNKKFKKKIDKKYFTNKREMRGLTFTEVVKILRSKKYDTVTEMNKDDSHLGTFVRNRLSKNERAYITKTFFPDRKARDFTLDECKERAAKYGLRMGWRRGDFASYAFAKQNGWLDICCRHMDQLIICIELNRTFKSISEASRELNIGIYKLRRAIKSGKKINGYSFKKEKTL